MAIEFECPECRATLRVGDEARGKKAKCPQCGKISELPHEVASSPSTAIEPVVSLERGGEALDLGGSQITKGPMLPARITFNSVLSRGWKIASERYSLALAGSTLFLLLSFAGGMIANALSEWAHLVGDPISIVFVHKASNFLFDTWLSGGVTLFFLNLTRGQLAQIGDLFLGGKYFWRILGVNLILVLLFSLIILFGCGIPALIGYLAASDGVVVTAAENQADVIKKEKLEEIARAEGDKVVDQKLPVDQSSKVEPKVKEIDHGLAQNGDRLDQNPRAEAAMTGFGIGFIVVFIPMILLGIMFSQAVILVVDRGMGSVEALRQSIRITRGNRWTLFLLGVVLAFIVLAFIGPLVSPASVGVQFIGFLGALACGVGLFFVMPLIWVIGTTAFLAMTGQLPER